MSGIDYLDPEKTILNYAPSDVTDVDIISSVKIIRGFSETNYSFIKCATKLERVNFLDNSQLETIQDYAFYSCSSLLSIDLSKCTKLTTIGMRTFNKCTKLNKVLFPESLVNLGQYSFSEDSSLTSITLPASLQYIGSCPFHYCTELSKVKIPFNSKLESFPAQFFRNCKIQSLFIPEATKYYAPSTLEGVSTVLEITVDPKNKYYKSIDGVLYTFNETEIVAYPSNKGSSYSVSDGVISLGSVSFDSSQITSIELPSSLKTIGSHCFKSSKLISIEIPDSVTEIGASCFSQCGQLSSVKLSESLTCLKEECFYKCGLTTITIPANVTTIENSCFAYNGNLEKVILPSSLTTLGGGVFANCSIELTFEEGSQLYIDDQYLILNKENTSVKQYLASTENADIYILPTVKTIQNRAFLGKTNVISVTFEEGSVLETIEKEAFADCTSLQRINFPETLQTIHDSAFRSTAITEVNLKNIFSSLGEKAFEKCMNLTTVTFTDSPITIFNAKVFYECISLHTFEFSSSVSEIGEYCFFNCKLLEKLQFPGSLTKIGQKAFEGSGLKEVSFHAESEMTTLSSYSFYGCLNLSSFDFPDSIQVIEPYALAECGFVELTLPPTVTELGMNALSGNQQLTTFNIPEGELETFGKCVFEKCINLEQIICNNTNFTIDNTALLDSSRSRIIAFPPKSHVKFFYVLQSIKKIDDSAFSNCANLIHVLIPDNSVETINLRAFQNCTKLAIINIPSSVTSVGIDIFTGCKNLKCGINLEVSDEVKDQLLTNGGLNANQLKPCDVQRSCKYNNNYHISIKYYSIFILFFVETH